MKSMPAERKNAQNILLLVVFKTHCTPTKTSRQIESASYKYANSTLKIKNMYMHARKTGDMTLMQMYLCQSAPINFNMSTP